jgi:hypothetical protein
MLLNEGLTSHHENGSGSAGMKMVLVNRRRNRRLGTAVVLLWTDVILSFVFTLLAPADPRLATAFESRWQERTVYLQGFVAIMDTGVAVALGAHAVQGVLIGSLDTFLESAAVKLLQALFFTLLQARPIQPHRATRHLQHTRWQRWGRVSK